MSTDEIPGWFAVNGFRVLASLLLAVLGWYITDTLAEIKRDMRETAQGVQVLMQNREATNARLTNIEQTANRNADRVRELERTVWQGRSTTTAPH